MNKLPHLNPLSSIIKNPLMTRRGSSTRWETQRSPTTRLGTYGTPPITSASNGTPTTPTLVTPTSACWRIKVIPSQPPTRMMPLPTPTAATLTLTSAASAMLLTILMSLVYFHMPSMSWATIWTQRTPLLHI